MASTAGGCGAAANRDGSRGVSVKYKQVPNNDMIIIFSSSRRNENLDKRCFQKYETLFLYEVGVLICDFISKTLKGLFVKELEDS